MSFVVWIVIMCDLFGLWQITFDICNLACDRKDLGESADIRNIHRPGAPRTVKCQIGTVKYQMSNPTTSLPLSGTSSPPVGRVLEPWFDAVDPLNNY